MARGAAEAVQPGRRTIAAALAIALVVGCTGNCLGQEGLSLRAAFAAGAHRTGVPAVAWLCSSHLPKRPEWPRGLLPAQPFTLSISPGGLTIRASEVPLPPHVVAAGSCGFGAAPPLLWSCADDGTEDWFLPLEAHVPAPFGLMLQALEADLLDEPRRLDASVVIGHLAPAMSDGEPRAELLHLGASLCGEVTWIAWRTPTHVRVRGRSDGGLLLPAALLALASEGSPGTTGAMSLRAFGARDGDRAEAARQLSRTSGEAPATLRALLHAEDHVRLAAIDALVRLHAVEEMPRIVAAADPTKPWATLAAADAVRELWVDAPPSVRQRTRLALAQSPSRDLRAIDTASLATKRPAEAPLANDDAGGTGLERGRCLLLLGLLAVGLHGLWRRERCLLRRA